MILRWDIAVERMVSGLHGPADGFIGKNITFLFSLKLLLPPAQSMPVSPLLGRSTPVAQDVNAISVGACIHDSFWEYFSCGFSLQVCFGVWYMYHGTCESILHKLLFQNVSLTWTQQVRVNLEVVSRGVHAEGLDPPSPPVVQLPPNYVHRFIVQNNSGPGD